MKLLLILPLLALASCGATVCYNEPNTGIRICEKIDGAFNPVIEIPDSGLIIGDDVITVNPAK